MHEDLSQIKAKVKETLDQEKAQLKDLGQRIFENPELKFEEHRAAEWITEVLEEKGFSVKRKVGGMETALVGRCPEGSEGPTIAFLSEYDALPGLGHACGHNLIATIGVGAAIGLCSVLEKLPGEVLLIGTPAEEGGGGKIELVESGIFEEVDAAMMVHPSDKSQVSRGSLGIQELEMDFYGEPAHAASNPEKGINALDAVISTFNNINALREHTKESSRIHGIITNGGDKPNIVPEKASAKFYVRAKELPDLEKLLEKVKNCAKAGAVATGAELELSEVGRRYCPIKPNQVMASLYEDNLSDLGENLTEEDSGGMGSTDMGNLSQEVPAIHPYIQIAEKDTPGHSKKFANAANSERGYSAMITAAKALALTGVDLLGNENLMQNAKKEFKNS